MSGTLSIPTYGNPTGYLEMKKMRELKIQIQDNNGTSTTCLLCQAEGEIDRLQLVPLLCRRLHEHHITNEIPGIEKRLISHAGCKEYQLLNRAHAFVTIL